MPVPSSLADLSTTAASNSPAGSDAIGTSLDDYLRTTQALLKQALSKGTDIASAGTISIPNNGNYCVVTGTTTISTISDSWTGRVVFLKFSGALTLTNSASLILPGGVSITTVAGDCATFVNESTGVWRCIDYQKYSLAPGVASSASESSSGPNASAFTLRNKIINGSMKVDQRNAGAAQTITAGAALAYTVDRWYAYCTGANVTGQQITTNGSASYRFTGATSNTGVGFGTRLEAANVYDLVSKSCKLQVKLSSSSLTSITWTAYYANTADTFGTLASPTRTQIATGTFTINSTEATYTADISVSAGAYTGIEIVFTGGALLGTQTLTIGDVQFEQGTVATPFEQRPYGLELSLCQRYYEKSYDIATVPGTTTQTGIFVSGINIAGSVQGYVRFKVEKRSTPSVRLWDKNSNGTTSVGTYTSGGVFTTRTASPASPCTTQVTVATATSDVAIEFHYDASAEL